MSTQRPASPPRGAPTGETTRRSVCTLGLLVGSGSLGACAGLFSKKPSPAPPPPPPSPPPPPPPKPGTLAISIAASPTINPNAGGRPSPLVVRIYELKASAQFESADFLSLYDKDQSILGADIVARDELVLRPGESKVINKPLAAGTQFVGVVAAFRELERARWRDVRPVLPNKDNAVSITLDGITVRILVSST